MKGATPLPRAKLISTDEMNNRLTLYVPKLWELWYRKKLLSDPDTMSYNKGYNLNSDIYHNDTGCIDFPEDRWKQWYDYFVNNFSQCYYAYIKRIEDGCFIGEVNLHKSNNGDWYDMGIVLEGQYRGQGFSQEALELLLNEAFCGLSATEVRNDFELTRKVALKLHLAVGFQIVSEENGIVLLKITKESYSKT